MKDKAGLLSLFAAVLMQCVTAVWWAADATSRLQAVEKWQTSNDRTSDRLTKLETKVDYIGDGVARVEQLLISKTLFNHKRNSDQ